ncbi:MAG: molybdopterin-dependent oxidoreductase [Xanthomonadales bacterium]|nr:molybdopterin-dependent oxidoreductase [Xanthomonadales bacterium]
MTTHFRACPLCEAICGLSLRTEEKRLLQAQGDPDDPFSRGHVCPKGTALVDLESDPDRLTRPLLRQGQEWREIEWDEALDRAGQGLAALQREHGPNGLAVYLGNPNVHHFGHTAYLPGLLRLLRTQNVHSASSVDQWPHQLVAAQMYGHQFLIPIPDLDQTDVFVMLGANPVASNGSLMTAPGVRDRLKALVRRGHLLVIDPRRTETAALASEHWAIRPAADAGLLLCLLDALCRLGPPHPSAALAASVGLDEALGEIRAAAADPGLDTGGIPRSQIEALALRLHAAERSVVYGRMGVSTQRHGTLCQWLIQLINLYLGQLDQVGGVLPNRTAVPLIGPLTGRGAHGRWHSRVRGLPEFAGELPVSVLAEEILTPGAGQVRGLLTLAGNPVLSTPQGDRLGGALAGLDFMVSVDIYLNETTRHANLILPPASALTQDHYDLIFNGFAVRRVARLSTALWPRKATERGDWEILDGLAAAYARHAGKDHRPAPAPRQLLAHLLASGDSGLTVEELAKQPHGLDLGPLEPCLLAQLQTPDQRIQCAPALLLEGLASYREHAGQAVDVGFPLRLIGRREVRDNNSWMHNLPRLRKGRRRDALWMHPQDLAARGLRDGDDVAVASAVGAIRTIVQTSDDLQPGVVCLPHGYGHGHAGTRQHLADRDPGASYNDLTDASALDGPSGNAALNGLPVQVSAVASA